ncbi:hypothetical protein HZA99_02875 [Candidatus Woesearchaeota archaeon]|nr:hypothetical protein [Candidatus Woesearchaeota archaeon]
MNKKLLITRPEHDDTTYYLSYWSKKAIEIAETKGITVFDLSREKANRNKTEGILKKQEPKLVIFNGHGREDAVGGHKNEPLIVAKQNETLLKEKITYAISCKSAKELGPESVKQGAKAYLGYEEDFIFFYEPKKMTEPLADKTAELFLEPSREAMLSLIKGNSVEEAEKRTKNMFKENMIKLLSSEVTKEEASMARYLWWNMKHLTIHGDKTATF